MIDSRKAEARALDADEREMIEATHHPEIQDLNDKDLHDLARRVRERRDRAQRLAQQRRREMRGKAAPRGAEASRDDSGSKLKADVLASAMRRINAEVKRRSNMRARLTLIANQQRAYEMAHALERGHEQFNSRTAHDGMRPKQNRKTGRIGSAMEAGRVSQFMKVAQAKKDAR
ncbi:MAG: hypothetical protein AAFY02_07285 [Pseudomonadota bacterium]